MIDRYMTTLYSGGLVRVKGGDWVKWSDVEQLQADGQTMSELLADDAEVIYKLKEEIEQLQAAVKYWKEAVQANTDEYEEITEEQDKTIKQLQSNLDYPHKDEWPCQQLLGGTGAAIYSNVDGMCTHPECKPPPEDKV